MIKKNPSDVSAWTFQYQKDTYAVVDSDPITFSPLAYPCTDKPSISTFTSPKGLTQKKAEELITQYGKNEFDIPIPTFTELFSEHATAPFFVFQIFCVALWCLDEYWYYSLFTLFMLVVFECTVVWQVCGFLVTPREPCINFLFFFSKRLKTLTEFRTMAVAPFPIQCMRSGKWVTIQTDDLLPGDVVSVGKNVFPFCPYRLL